MSCTLWSHKYEQKEEFFSELQHIISSQWHDVWRLYVSFFNYRCINEMYAPDDRTQTTHGELGCALKSVPFGLDIFFFHFSAIVLWFVVAAVIRFLHIAVTRTSIHTAWNDSFVVSSCILDCLAHNLDRYTFLLCVSIVCATIFVSYAIIFASSKHTPYKPFLGLFICFGFVGIDSEPAPFTMALISS